MAFGPRLRFTHGKGASAGWIFFGRPAACSHRFIVKVGGGCHCCPTGYYIVEHDAQVTRCEEPCWNTSSRDFKNSSFLTGCLLPLVWGIGNHVPYVWNCGQTVRPTLPDVLSSGNRVGA